MPKTKTLKNEKYLDYIREQPCLLCGKKADPHHESGLGIGLVGGGTGKKCTDLVALPLCCNCHRKRHDKGYITFWLNYGGLLSCIDVYERAIADGVVMREVLRLLFGYDGHLKWRKG